MFSIYEDNKIGTNNNTKLCFSYKWQTFSVIQIFLLENLVDHKTFVFLVLGQESVVWMEEDEDNEEEDEDNEEVDEDNEEDYEEE